MSTLSISQEQTDIIKNFFKIETFEDVISGDIWFSIDSADEKYSEHGIFVHVEYKELDVGEYSDEIFCVSGYRNYLSECGEYTEFDYDVEVFDFEVDVKDLKSISEIIKSDTAKESV